MKTHQPPTKLKTQLFSCGFFRHCTQTVLSPTAASDHPPQPPPSNDTSFPRRRQAQPSSSSSSSSSSSASHSFTQWRLPLSASAAPPEPVFRAEPDPDPKEDVAEVFRRAGEKLGSGSEAERMAGLHMLERALVMRDPPGEPECPPAVMRGVVGWGLAAAAAARPASKVLLALCLAEPNRRVAVEAGAVAAVVEAAAGEMEGAAAERAMAALELMCTVPEGAAAVRAHALAVPVMVAAMGRPSPRERECAMSVLAVIYGGACGDGEEDRAPPEEVARAVELAMQGDCSARGRRKGLSLLKALHDSAAAEQQQQQQLQQTTVV